MSQKTISENKYVYSWKNIIVLVFVFGIALTGILVALFEAESGNEVAASLAVTAFLSGIGIGIVWKDKSDWEKEKLGGK